MVPLAERIYKYCELNCIDDEVHLITKCTFHESARNNLIENITPYINITSTTNQEKFTYILKSERHVIILALGIVLNDSFSKGELRKLQ